MFLPTKSYSWRHQWFDQATAGDLSPERGFLGRSLAASVDRIGNGRTVSYWMLLLRHNEITSWRRHAKISRSFGLVNFVWDSVDHDGTRLRQVVFDRLGELSGQSKVTGWQSVQKHQSRGVFCIQNRSDFAGWLAPWRCWSGRKCHWAASGIRPQEITCKIYCRCETHITVT